MGKPWYKSLTIISAITSGLSSVATLVMIAAGVAADGPIASAVVGLIAAGGAVWGRLVATEPIGSDE